MQHEKIILDSHESYLTTYVLDNYETLDPERLRAFVLICPGGGYEHLSVRESEAVAIKFNSLGFNSAVLTYTLAPMAFPDALVDLAEAVKYIRSNAKKLNTNPDKIFVFGFSAGAHLSGTLGCYWNSELLKSRGFEKELIKPNGLLLCYPVITADENFCHKGSILNVLGNSSFSRDDVSLEKHVTSDFPKTFMWHTTQDEAVPTENSLLMAMALRKAKIPFEYHLFEKGKHGLALATEETSKPNGETVEPTCAEWINLAANWLRDK